jgi:regulatory protein
MSAEDRERCYLAALRILQYRWNSELELRRKLGRKRFDDDAVDAAIARLREEKWLDDGRFAEALVRTRSARRLGRKRIANELRAAGVDNETASDAIRRNLDPEREAEGLQAACERRMRVMARRHGEAFLTTDEGRNKLAIYLLNQGYDAALVQSTVRSAIKEIKVADDQPNP